LLAHAIKALGVRGLPLQKALMQGSVALDDDLSVRVLASLPPDHPTDAALPRVLRYKIGVQYTSIISGCSCVDDPTPMSVLPEYCEFMLDIDRVTGNFSLLLED
jgi:hypothetical protein